MKKELPQYDYSPDGSVDLGNGVIGPSGADIKHFNFRREQRKRNRLNVLVPSLLGLLAAACGGAKIQNPQTNDAETAGNSSGYELPFPKGETWFLTNGPHADGWSNGVKYALDIAPPELGRLNGECPKDGSRLSIDNRVVTASASGEVIIAGSDKDRNDPHHSEVRIKDNKGLTEVYIHLDHKKVNVGDKVKQGDPLGNPSCEFPPGGANSGPHVHEGLMKDGQAIPIDGVVIGGWTIHAGTNDGEGTMTKQGQTVRIANPRRCNTDAVCKGLRNDLTSGPKQEVLGAAVGAEKPVEAGWTRFRSSTQPFQIDYPPDWDHESSNLNPTSDLGLEKSDTFRKDSYIRFDTFNVYSGPLSKSLNSFKDDLVKRMGATTVLETPNQIIDGERAWKLEPHDKDAPDIMQYIYLVQKDQKTWVLQLYPSSLNDNHKVSQNIATLQKMLDSFKFLSPAEFQIAKAIKPTETPKPTPTIERQAESGWTRFKSFELPYQIDHPSNWQQAGNQFYGETTKTNRPLFQVASKPVASWITLDDLKNQFVQSTKDTIKLLGANVQITEMPNQSLNGQKAWRLDAIVRSSVATPNRSVTYVTIKDGKAWTITYAADDSEFNQKLPTFGHMLASFKFLK